MTEKIRKLELIESNQEVLTQQLMDAIRAEIMNGKYDHLKISTLIGILAMLQMEMYERN